MNVEIGTVAAQSLFWEYLFQIFGIGSLQCIRVNTFCNIYDKCEYSPDLQKLNKINKNR